jgi:hypothetical protein
VRLLHEGPGVLERRPLPPAARTCRDDATPTLSSQLIGDSCKLSTVPSTAATTRTGAGFQREFKPCRSCRLTFGSKLASAWRQCGQLAGGGCVPGHQRPASCRVFSAPALTKAINACKCLAAAYTSVLLGRRCEYLAARSEEACTRRGPHPRRVVVEAPALFRYVLPGSISTIAGGLAEQRPSGASFLLHPRRWTPGWRTGARFPQRGEHQKRQARAVLVRNLTVRRRFSPSGPVASILPPH